jgi:hypothetical protein
MTNIIQFKPRTEKRWIPMPEGANYFDQFVEFDVEDDSLSDIGIKAGMILTCRRNFELSEIKQKICVVYDHNTDRQFAQMIDDIPENIEVLALAVEIRIAI